MRTFCGCISTKTGTISILVIYGVSRTTTEQAESQALSQSSELGLPHPLARRRVCPLPPLVRESGTPAGEREGVGESQFRRGDIHCGTLYNIYVLCGVSRTTILRKDDTDVPARSSLHFWLDKEREQRVMQRTRISKKTMAPEAYSPIIFSFGKEHSIALLPHCHLYSSYIFYVYF